MTPVFRSRGARSAGPFVLPLALVLLAAACGGQADAKSAQGTPKGTPKRAPATAPDADATRVEVAVLGNSDATLEATMPGEVEGSREAVLASAQGGPVERVFVKEGQHVTSRQLLMHVDTALYAIRYKQAEHELSRARRDAERGEGLAGALPAAERERRGAEVVRLENALELAQLQLDRSKIRAPFAGVITKLHTEVGEVVGATAPLLNLVRLDPVHVVLSVPDRDMVALSPGAAVEVRVGARSGAIAGTIARISPTGDGETRTFRAEVEVENPGLTLLPGMIASVTVAAAAAEASVIIPQDWLVTRRDGVGVFVEEDGKARYLPVTAGRVVRDQVVIDQGLQVGARIIINGHRGLAQGDALAVAREGVCCSQGRAIFE